MADVSHDKGLRRRYAMELWAGLAGMALPFIIGYIAISGGATTVFSSPYLLIVGIALVIHGAVGLVRTRS